MQRPVTKRVLSIAGAAAIGGLVSLSAVAQTTTSISLVGSSPNSWEEAAKNAVDEAGLTLQLRNLRIAEVEKFDLRLENGKVVEYRVRVRLKIE
jgi:dodecin